MFSPVLHSKEDIFHAVEQLAAENSAIFLQLGYPLDLLQQNIRYQAEPDGENIYANVYDVLARGVGDCEDFSAWLMAYLRWYNIRCEPLLLQQSDHLYHVCVVAFINNRWVALDPSKWLGMCYYYEQCH